MLGTGVCGSRPRNGEINWNQVVYLWCSRLVTLVVLDSCGACGSFQMSLGNWMEARWKYDRGRRFCNFPILLQVSQKSDSP